MKVVSAYRSCCFLLIINLIITLNHSLVFLFQFSLYTNMNIVQLVLGALGRWHFDGERKGLRLSLYWDFVEDSFGETEYVSDLTRLKLVWEGRSKRWEGIDVDKCLDTTLAA